MRCGAAPTHFTEKPKLLTEKGEKGAPVDCKPNYP